jgi:ClpP class serine protease
VAPSWALTADQIVMDPNAVLGPVDPQIDDMPAASIVKVLGAKPLSQISDDMLVRADLAQKARVQGAAALATALSEGRWTHDFPIMVEGARELGLPVSTDMPPLIYDLMDLYPQAGTNRPSVLYVPLRRHQAGEDTPAATPATGQPPS